MGSKFQCPSVTVIFERTVHTGRVDSIETCFPVLDRSLLLTINLMIYTTSFILTDD